MSQGIQTSSAFQPAALGKLVPSKSGEVRVTEPGQDRYKGGPGCIVRPCQRRGAASHTNTKGSNFHSALHFCTSGENSLFSLLPQELL